MAGCKLYLPLLVDSSLLSDDEVRQMKLDAMRRSLCGSSDTYTDEELERIASHFSSLKPQVSVIQSSR